MPETSGDGCRQPGDCRDTSASPDKHFLGSVRLYREGADALCGEGLSAEIVVGSSARAAEMELRSARGEAGAPAAASDVEPILKSIEHKGYGKLALSEHDWDEGWLLIEARETLESRAFLDSGGLTDYGACDILRGLILGSYRFLRKRADLPAEGLRAVEVACAARGDAACRFAVGTPDVLRAHGIEPVAVDLTSRVELEDMLRKSREGESGFRKFIEEMPFGIVRLDLEGRVTFANRKALDMLALPLHAAVGRHFAEFIHLEDREQVSEGFRKVVEGRADPYPTPCRLVRSDGAARPSAVDAFPVHDDRGRVVGYQGIALDLEDRERLGFPGLRFRQGLRESSRAYMEFDPDGRLRHANAAAVELLGTGREEATGASFGVLVAGEGSPGALRAFMEVAAGKRGYAACDCAVAQAEGATRAVRLELVADGLVTGRIESVLVLAEEASDRDGLLRALRESEEQLRLFKDQDLMGIAVVHENGVKFVNPAATAISGFTAEEVSAWGEDSFVMAIHPDDRAFVLEQFRKRQAGDPSAAEQYTFRMLRKSGETRWVEIRARRVEYGGEPATLAAFADVTDVKKAEAELERHRDKLEELVEERTADLTAANAELEKEVAERKQAEGALRFSEERLRAVFDSAMDGIVILERDSMLFRAANEAFCRMLGYGRSEVTQIGVTDIHPEDELPHVHEEISQQLRREKTLSREIRVKRKDGSVFYADINASPVTIDDDVYLLGVFRDVTERRAAEEKVREAEEKWQSLAENSREIIMTVDRKGEITYTGRTLEGYDRDATVGTSVYDYIDSDHHVLVRETLERVFAAGRPDSYMVRGPGPDGAVSWYETSVAPVRRDGEVVSAILIAADITERKRAEEQLQTILSRSPIPTAVGGPDGSIISFNKAMEELTGYQASELRDVADWTDKLYPDAEYRAFVWENIQQALRGEQQDCTEFTIARKDGQKRVGRFETAFFSGGLIIQVVDITESKRAGEALRDSEERFRTFAEMLPEIVYEADARGRIVFTNKRAYEITGHTREEMESGLAIADLLVPEDRARAVANVRRVLQGEQVGLNEYTVCRRDGSTFPVLVCSERIIRDDATAGLRGLVVDISEREEAEKALRESEELHRALTDSLPNAVAMTDLEGRITYVSPRSVEMHGAETAEELLGRSAFDLIAPEDRDRASANLQKTMEAGVVSGIEYTLLTSDGDRFPGELSAAVVPDARGKPKGFVAITRDLTERKHAEKALREVEGKREELAFEVARQHHRPGPEDARGIRHDPRGRAHERHGPDPGRDGDGQGARREGGPLQQHAGRQRLCQGGLRGAGRDAPRERALRPREGRLHRRRPRTRRQVRARPRRDRLPRRGAEPLHAPPGKAPARRPGGPVREGGGHRDDGGRRPHSRRDQRGSRAPRRPARVPEGPLLPAERDTDPAPSARRAKGRRAPARPQLHRALRRAARQGRHRRVPGGARQTDGLRLAGERPRAGEHRRTGGRLLARADDRGRRDQAAPPRPGPGERLLGGRHVAPAEEGARGAGEEDTDRRPRPDEREQEGGGEAPGHKPVGALREAQAPRAFRQAQGINVTRDQQIPLNRDVWNAHEGDGRNCTQQGCTGLAG
jgi:PAS domain S-box-containing protein